MKIMVLGQGGREHAIVKALSLSNSVKEVHAIPGNPGMTEALCHDVSLSDVQSISKRCQEISIDLVVIGPEAPLAQGLADDLRSGGFLVFGPSRQGAWLEASKIHAKEFMVRHGVPTAKSYVVGNVRETMKYATEFDAPYVLKADGLAAGKGVFICSTLRELEEKAKLVFESRILGASGAKALLEEGLKGYELSYLVLTNGTGYRGLVLSQDHKRLQEGNMGPNTGGMGALAPISIGDKERQTIEEVVVKNSIQGLQRDNIDFRGVLYIGIMMTEEGPKVLEYNVRFGDPEAQVLLPLLDGDWGVVFSEIAKGNLPDLEWKNLFACCVVMAAEGYPENSVKGTELVGDPLGQTASSYFLHAATVKNEAGNWVTNGGRVLNAVGIGSDIPEAIAQAYRQMGKVKWQGVQYRTDIGKQFL